MKNTLVKWLISATILALLLGGVCWSDEAGDGGDAEEPQPEISFGGSAITWLDGEEPDEPQPEISWGVSGAARLDADPNEPQPELAPGFPKIISLETDPNEPQPESC